jgi:hypothetical protein
VKEDKMSGRKNTIVCSIDQRSPRLSAYDIHEWIGITMNLRENEVPMVQIDGGKRQVYIKVREYQRMCEIQTATQGDGKIRHSNGKMSTVSIEAAGMGIK